MGLSYEAVPILWHFAFDFWLSGRVPVISVQSTRVPELFHTTVTDSSRKRENRRNPNGFEMFHQF